MRKQERLYDLGLACRTKDEKDFLRDVITSYRKSPFSFLAP